MRKMYLNMSNYAILNNIIITTVVILLTDDDYFNYWISVYVLSAVLIIGVLVSSLCNEEWIYKHKGLLMEMKYFLVITSFIFPFVVLLASQNGLISTMSTWLVHSIIVLMILSWFGNIVLGIHLIALERVYLFNYPEVVTEYKTEIKGIWKQTIFYLPMSVFMVIVSIFMAALSGGWFASV